MNNLEYIKSKLSLLPMKPGCYLMKNKDGIIIYVGKAKKLKNRVSSYFRGTHTGKTARLVKEIWNFEYVVVESETESLILEINLIKKYDPKYNILLRDDKSYPYIELTNEDVPRLNIVRDLNKKKNKNQLYGPYPNVTAARDTVNLLNRMFPLRKCTTYNKRPCLYYHIGQCLGYCTHNVDKELINNMKSDIIKFLNGNTKIITDKIEEEMYKESSKLNFEKAKELKELLDNIETTANKQKIETKDTTNRDVIGYYIYKGYISIQIFFIRGGKIVGRHSKIFALVDSTEEELNRYIAHFYTKSSLPPKEILVPDIVDIKTLNEVLNTKFVVPQKGLKDKLVDMAINNAKITVENDFTLINRDEERTYEANEELRKLLNLDKLDRIELFDNSHLFGTYSVSGMVVFKDGKPSKNDYRKFKIKLDTNDEYSMMKEVTYRRYFRVLKDNLEKPDLIIVDGGLGQINIVREVVDSLGLNIMVVGLKKNNKHITEALLAGNPIEELEVDKKSNLFFLLERMQDEVHNFTIAYHRQIRSKGTLASVLDNVEGIGEKRKKELLKKYKTINKLKSLDKEELTNILPLNVAENLIEFLKNY